MTNITLPAWCRTPEARPLIAAVIAERPVRGPDRFRLPATYGGYAERLEVKYEGRAAAKLRACWRREVERAFALADEDFKRGVPWDEAGATANTMLRSTADMVIEQLLATDSQRRAA